MIKLVPLTGFQRIKKGHQYIREPVVTNIDNIMDGQYCIGHVLRKPGAPICFLVRVAPTVEEEVRRAVDARDAEMWDGETYYDTAERKIGRPPNIPKELLE